MASQDKDQDKPALGHVLDKCRTCSVLNSLENRGLLRSADPPIGLSPAPAVTLKATGLLHGGGRCSAARIGGKFAGSPTVSDASPPPMRSCTMGADRIRPSTTIAIGLRS